MSPDAALEPGLYRVERVPYSPGHSYDRELRVMHRNQEVAVVNADAVSLDALERIVGLINLAGTDPYFGGGQ